MSKKKKVVPWTIMIKETGIRDRLIRENPNALKLLDYLATRKKPYDDGVGWTVFNDWLDDSFKFVDKRPEDVPFVDRGQIREAVFPACR